MLDKDFWILLADDSYLELQICQFCDAPFILAKVPVRFQGKRWSTRGGRMAHELPSRSNAEISNPQRVYMCKSSSEEKWED